MVKHAKLGPAFANIFTANLASSLGDGIARTAMPLLAARLTDDAFLIAGLSAIVMLPWLLFAIPAGILIDHIDRRKALALAQAVRTVLGITLLVLVLTDSVTIWWIYLIAFVYGAFETVYDGAIRAVVPSIVRKADLPRANAYIEGGELVTQSFVAGPVTSALFAFAVFIPFGINGLVFAVAGALALLLPKIASGRQFMATNRHAESVWYRQYLDGFRFIRSNRMLVTLWLFSTFVGLSASASTASFVLFILHTLEVPEAFFGVFLLSGAVGGILGTLITQRLKAAWGAGTAMAVASTMTGVSFLLIGVVPQLWAGALGFALSSVAVTVWNVLVMSLRQAIIPGRLLGRVHGTWRTLLWGTMPIGALIGGVIGRVDLALPFIVGGAAITLSSLLLFRFLMTLPNPEDVDNGDDVPDDAAEAGPIDPLTQT